MIDDRVHTSPIKRRKISDDKFRVFQKCFCVDCTATQTSILVGVNRNTAQRYLSFFRKRVLAAAWQEREVYAIGNGGVKSMKGTLVRKDSEESVGEVPAKK